MPSICPHSFHLLDKDRSGTLEFRELHRALRPGYVELLLKARAEEIRKEELDVARSQGAVQLAKLESTRPVLIEKMEAVRGQMDGSRRGVGR